MQICKISCKVCIHQPFSRTFFVFLSKFCKFKTFVFLSKFCKFKTFVFLSKFCKFKTFVFLSKFCKFKTFVFFSKFCKFKTFVFFSKFCKFKTFVFFSKFCKFKIFVLVSKYCKFKTFVFFSKVCQFESNATSNWLNRRTRLRTFLRMVKYGHTQPFLRPVYTLHKRSSVCIHQPFSRTFFVFFSKVCKLECNTTSDWLNRMV